MKNHIACCSAFSIKNAWQDRKFVFFQRPSCKMSDGVIRCTLLAVIVKHVNGTYVFKPTPQKHMIKCLIFAFLLESANMNHTMCFFASRLCFALRCPGSRQGREPKTPIDLITTSVQSLCASVCLHLALLRKVPKNTLFPVQITCITTYVERFRIQKTVFGKVSVGTRTPPKSPKVGNLQAQGGFQMSASAGHQDLRPKADPKLCNLAR